MKKYISPQIDMQVLQSCDVIQTSGGFMYEESNITYAADGSMGDFVDLW